MTDHSCPSCGRDTDEPVTGMCVGCANRVRQQLREIVDLAHQAAETLEPGRNGSTHAAAYGSRPPLNIVALDYAATLGWSTTVQTASGAIHVDRDGLGMLHEWERLIREERHLTPVAYVPYAGTRHKEIMAACGFLTTHLEWACAQAWASEMVSEVSEVHRAGQVALRAVPERQGRIACPGELAEGGTCGAWLMLPASDKWDDYLRQPGETHPRRTLYCRICGTDWTIDRLLHVARAMYGVTLLAKAFGDDVLQRIWGWTDRKMRQHKQDERMAATQAVAMEG